ncbi:hypothetical protein B0O99DRAFT_695679 [Bisporella sp. PMI_857]|nr:hypothetical protein B0O99DRAFT_695679 [Bisporella sp. PMI_857]
MFTACRSSESQTTLGKKGEREFNSGAYDVLADDSDLGLLGEQLKLRRKASRWPKALTSLSVAFGLACLFIVYLSVELSKVNSAHSSHPTIHRTGKELGDCGKTIPEARAAGCHFDPMSWLWIPKACWNPHQDLINSWKASTDWHFYDDVGMRPENEVSIESTYNGDYPVIFTPYKYHKIHCSYMWRKTQAILTERLPMDSNTLSNRHMNHCQMVLLNEFFHQDVNCTESETQICPIRLTQEYTTCGYF